MVAEQGSTTSPLYWNLGKEGALADARFRRACAMAIDRQDLVNRLAAGRGVPGNPGFLSPANPFFAPVRQYDFDVAGANALLEGAGYRAGAGGGTRRDQRGNPLSFELLIGNGEAPLSELLVAALRRIGVELRPKLVELGPQLFGNKLIGAYDMAVLFFPGPGPGGPNADPDVLRLLFSSKVPPSLQAASSYANPAFDELADKQRSAFDEQERKDLVAQMQRLLADDLPILPLYYPETIHAVPQGRARPVVRHARPVPHVAGQQAAVHHRCQDRHRHPSPAELTTSPWLTLLPRPMLQRWSTCEDSRGVAVLFVLALVAGGCGNGGDAGDQAGVGPAVSAAAPATSPALPTTSMVAKAQTAVLQPTDFPPGFQPQADAPGEGLDLERLWNELVECLAVASPAKGSGLATSPTFLREPRHPGPGHRRVRPRLDGGRHCRRARPARGSRTAPRRRSGPTSSAAHRRERCRDRWRSPPSPRPRWRRRPSPTASRSPSTSRG